MKNKLYTIILLFFISCISSLKTEFPEKKFYVLEPNMSEIKKYPIKVNSIKIINFRISNLFESKGFIYKYKNSSFDIDFYHEFLVPVTGMITEKTGDWLIQSGLVKHTANRSRLLESELILEGYIKSIYGDFSDEKNPKAIIIIDFYLLNSESLGIQMGRTYSQTIDIEKNTPDSLIRGYNLAITNILLDFSSDLSKLNINKKLTISE